MRYILLFTTFISNLVFAQNEEIQVRTLMKLNASGGLTTDVAGNLYISDFGKRLGVPDTTRVFKWDKTTGKVSVYAEGFNGASGACFDKTGNFYQSNPFGSSISKVQPDGTVLHDWASGFKTPVGLEADDEGSIFVAACGLNEIGRISPDGQYETFASSELLKCPNGLTQDDDGNLYACNFSDGKVLRIDKNGVVTEVVELPTLSGGPSPVGNGHLIYKNGWLFVTTIGTGEIYRVGMDGSVLRVAGKAFGFSNVDGGADVATFSKPNGIETSITGDTLYVNVSEPTWVADPPGLHPASVRMITGICSLPDANCNEKEIKSYPVKWIPVEADELNKYEIRSMLNDGQGKVWIGTKLNGIYLLRDQKLFRLESEGVSINGAIDIKAFDDGSVWFGGLGLYSLQNDRIYFFNEEFVSNRVNFSIRSGWNEEVVSCGNAGVTFLKNNVLQKHIGEGDGLPHPVVHDVFFEEEHDLWLATRKSGLAHLSKGMIDYYLQGVNCRKMLNTDDNLIVVGTATGALIFNTETKQQVWLIEDGFSVLPVMKDERNRIWCVSESHGVYVYEDEVLSSFPAGNNELNYFDLEFVGNQVWIGTNKGILKVDQ